ncbi:ClpXP protease specificity-enhancing factor [Thiopseudomonas denitrificans]|uniref:Stringent starvation protein B n=1 Tax=Thiopseudomonas denitrificans TaxID=1501432 RepID=A0A4R6U768_9GAMM|nr:ClpXP protease specificity-enhancing factor [Thiopseudomonas denitrificans]TDQ38884.1 stringent starvation protein B [Thiopseudomonas denitrificans]
MTPSKPYLIRALYEWIVDNECTPYLLVAAEAPGVIAPEGFAEHGQLILNLSPSAVRHFVMNNQVVSFEARFSGVPHQLVIPVYAVLAIYAQENGQGMSFEIELPEEGVEVQEETDEQPPPPKPGGRPSLRVVK